MAPRAVLELLAVGGGGIGGSGSRGPVALPGRRRPRGNRAVWSRFRHGVGETSASCE